MPKTYLKIKIMSLAAEARIIRNEERKWRGDHPVRFGLREHRVTVVRDEARVAQLAYGFVRGRSYAQLESNPKSTPNWARVATLAARYGDKKVTLEQVMAWVEQHPVTVDRLAA
jgi:hypothetical protein